MTTADGWYDASPGDGVLRDALARLADLQAQGRSAMLIDAGTMRVVDVNERAAAELREPRSALRGREVVELAGRANEPLATARVRRVLQRQADGYHSVRRIRRADGSHLTQAVNVEAIVDERGEVRFLLAVAEATIPDELGIDAFLNSFDPVLSYASEWFVAFDVAGRILGVAGAIPNRESLVGAPLRDLFDAQSAAAVTELLVDLANDRAPSEPLSLVCMLGDRCELAVQLSPWEEGVYLGVLRSAESAEVIQLRQQLHDARERLRQIAQIVWTAPSIARPAQTAVDGSVLERLQERERSVLFAVAQGKSVSRIAADLYVSESTVRNYLSSIYRKLGVSSIAGLRELLHDTASR